MSFDKKGIGAIWLREKQKNLSNGRVVNTKYLSMTIDVIDRKVKLKFVAFAAGKSANSSKNYPDFIIFPSGDETEKLLREFAAYLKQIGYDIASNSTMFSSYGNTKDNDNSNSAKDEDYGYEDLTGFYNNKNNDYN